MARYTCWLAGIVVGIAGLSASAEIQVPPGFVVDTLVDQIDGTTFVVEAIRNPDYGTGVVAASVDNGILTVLRISESTVDVLATTTGNWGWVSCIKFDTTGIFANELFVLTGTQTSGLSEVFQVSPQGNVNLVASLESGSGYIALLIAFSNGTDGYQSGAYLEDMGAANLYLLDGSYGLTLLGQNVYPAGRTDIDIRDLRFAPTGLYSSHLIMADSDPNDDNLSVIYEMLPDLTWQAITTPVNTATRFWGTGGLAMSSDGAFGANMYVADTRLQEILLVNEQNGDLTGFATGFSVVPASGWAGIPFSITLSDDGEHMFVSDDSGIYRIRAVTTEVGPTLAMRDPWVEADDVHTGPSGVDSLRLLWSERVLFDNEDISITNEDEEPVPFSVSGSNSQFMIIAFGEVLLNDVYTITISDSVVSVETGAAIDGDNDGLAGGDAILRMKHRNPFDNDRDSDVDLLDFGAFQAAFTGP